MSKEGMCTKCKEWTQVPGSCCGASVEVEGGLYHDDNFCDCADCSEDTNCMYDCGTCAGCLDRKKEREEIEYETKQALGYK